MAAAHKAAHVHRCHTVPKQLWLLQTSRKRPLQLPSGARKLPLRYQLTFQADIVQRLVHEGKLSELVGRRARPRLGIRQWPLAASTYENSSCSGR